MSKQTAQQPQSMIMNSEGSVSAEGAEIRGDLFLSCDTQLRFGVYVPPVKGSPACIGPARKFDPLTDTLRIPLFIDSSGLTGLIGINAPAVIVSSATPRTAPSALGWSKRPESSYLIQESETGGKPRRGVWAFYLQLTQEDMDNLQQYRGHEHGGLYSVRYSQDAFLSKYQPDVLTISSESDKSLACNDLKQAAKAEAA